MEPVGGVRHAVAFEDVEVVVDLDEVRGCDLVESEAQLLRNEGSWGSPRAEMGPAGPIMPLAVQDAAGEGKLLATDHWGMERCCSILFLAISISSGFVSIADGFCISLTGSSAKKLWWTGIGDNAKGCRAVSGDSCARFGMPQVSRIF